MSTGLKDKFKFDFDKPDFQKQFGGQTGTISEKRKKETQGKGGGSDNTADIIDASADGLDSITNFVSLFTGKTPTTETNYSPPPPPPPPKKVSPLVWGGGGLVVLLLIALLISSKNGQATE